MDPKNLIENYADDAARRSGLPEPERTEARHELVSHLYEKAQAIAGEEGLGSEHAKTAIKSLGSRDDVHRAFFGSYTGAHPASGWGRRSGAFVVDIIVMLVITTFVMGFFVAPFEPCEEVDAQLCLIMNVPGPVSFQVTNDDPAGGDVEPFHVSLRHNMHNYVTSLAFLAYFVVLEASWGRTLGKQAFGIRVLSMRGPFPSFLQGLGRNLAKIVLPLLLLDWLLGWAASGDKRLRVSDILVKTMVARN